MMRDVSGDYVSQRAYRNRIVTRYSRPRPRLIRQTLEERDRPETHVLKLLNQITPRSIVCVSEPDRDVLLKARQRIGKPAGKPERARGEHPFTIVHVVQNLANGPLPRLVRMKTLLFPYSAQKLEHLAHLILERGHDVVAGYKVNVFEIVVCCFGSLWSCHLGGNPNKKRPNS